MHSASLFTKYKRKKTYTIQFRVVATLIVAMLAISTFIGGISIYEVDNYIQGQAIDFVKVTCDNEKAQIDGSLGNMEKSVKIMESYLMSFFTGDVDIKDPSFQERVIKYADQMFVDVAKHTSTGGAVSYYFRFDPSISDSKSGLFYSKVEGSNDFISLEPTDILIYDKDDTEHVGWFWQPYEAGHPIWMDPYYNQNNNILMISYVVPMYYQGQFIGIVGMDFDFVVLSEKVSAIKLYENGFAHLEINGTVVHSENFPNKTNLQEDSSKYLQVSRELVNGMTLVLSASLDDIRQIRHDITSKIILVVLILAVVFTAIAVLVVRKIVDPLKKLTEASQKLSEGDYNVEIAQSSTYEIKLLTAAFENMANRLQEREELLHLSANRDSLTGLRNTTSYTAWVSKFDKAIEGKNAQFGVIVLDLNDLKETNDQYGHSIGNELIVTAAGVISGVFKRSLVFRIGGDEFLVVLQKKDLEEREKLFVQFDQVCAKTFVEGENAKIPLSIAMGYARFSSDKDKTFVDVFRRADDAMYQNKRKNKIG